MILDGDHFPVDRAIPQEGQLVIEAIWHNSGFCDVVGNCDTKPLLALLHFAAYRQTLPWF